MNSDDAILVNGPIDLIAQQIVSIAIQGENFVLSNGSADSPLATNAPIAEQQLLSSSQDGLYVDFSDILGPLDLDGGEQGDVLLAGSGDDNLKGGGGNDLLQGASGDDSLKGGGGDDILEGGLGSNTIQGGGDNDTVSYEHFDSPFEIVPGRLLGVIVDLRSGSGSDNQGIFLSDALTDISNIRGSIYEDELYGDDNGNVIEGGAGADTIAGGNGIDTISYAHSTQGVTVNLFLGIASGGDAQGDTFSGMEGLIGSEKADTLTGDNNVNILTGLAGNDILRSMGGADTLNGGLGNDQLIITDGGSSVHGGGGTDKLLLQSSDTFTFTGDTFDSIESVYVSKGASLDLSAITSGVSISSQSMIGASSTITGTQGADTIFSGKGTDTVNGGAGDDVIRGGSGYAVLFGDNGIDTIRAGANGATMDGGVGGDRLYGGAASDAFVFGADIGQDNVYNFQSGSDHLDVSALVDSFLDVNTRVLNGGKDTLVTFDGVDPAIKFVLRGVSSVQESDFDFGTQPTALVHHDWAV
ncbi:calcium-binding protein [Methylobacterium sp. Leaf91]|uniref:calcium-binding protein n=1 Tax=Methylobacterium sp. Leaf91 TaxID=1736247 RepID=UPI0012E75480|nr:calcium-binding protein [Methylobacterium sp. Leaf91]